MSDIVLKIEDLSKVYRLGEFGTGSISQDLNSWWARVRGKEDPNTMISQENDRTQHATSNYVHALKDINFDVKRGEVLGIIGKNGAGKSTLLKIISKITSPSSGSIKANGRIASLLEVGTGMHEEMTARENIFLNGAILGMRKEEIKRKFDEIIDFAGIAMYVDTPVKRFSSGMRVRLGFAVAAFLEPEILIVDEVLAVGDAEFQKKAIGKMKEVADSGGRTVLFVSHNMASVKSLCDTGIFLKNGMVNYTGTAAEVVDYYLNHEEKELSSSVIPDIFPGRINTGEAAFKEIKSFDSNERENDRFYFREDISFKMKIDIYKGINDGIPILKLKNSDGQYVLIQDNTVSDSSGRSFDVGHYQFSLTLGEDLLPGSYALDLGFVHSNGNAIDTIPNVKRIHVEKASLQKHQEYKWTKSWGALMIKNEIEIKKL